MFWKSVSYLIIPLILSFCSLQCSGSFYRIFDNTESESYSNNINIESYGISDCADDETANGFCQDCELSIECNSGEQINNVTCSQSQACEVKSSYSACAPVSEVIDCYCAPGETSQKPDPYDNTKYLVCNDGTRYILTCPDGVYDEESQSCTPQTTTPKIDIVCPPEDSKVSYNCTCYVFCLGGAPSTPICCELGQIYVDDTQSCATYEFFSCVGKVDGRYVDPHNCTIYYTCVDEEIFSTSYCPGDEIFDEDLGACTDGTCDTDGDCSVCPGSDLFIKVDCFTYYECIVNENYVPDSDDPADAKYIPDGPSYCPEGTCFNQDSGYCEPVVN